MGVCVTPTLCNVELRFNWDVTNIFIRDRFDSTNLLNFRLCLKRGGGGQGLSDFLGGRISFRGSYFG